MSDKATLQQSTPSLNSEASPEGECVVFTRGKHQPNTEKVEHRGKTMLEAFDAAYRYTEHPPGSEPVMWWDDPEKMAVCDVDWHGEVKPPSNAELALHGLPIAPVRFWTTPRGVKALHVGDGVFTAAELAAVWGYLFLKSRLAYGHTGIEVANQCHHPWYKRGDQQCGEVKEGYGGDLGAAIRQMMEWSSEVSDEDRDRWLEEQAMEMGRSYEHDRCPIDPGHASHSSPVWVGEWGVYCHSCNARGVPFEGCRKPGFVPYSRLCGGRPSANYLWRMARGWCHWEHAEFVMRHLDCPDPLAQLVYRSALKAAKLLRAVAEPDEGRRKSKVEQTLRKIDHVFTCVVPIVRDSGGLWVYQDRMEIASDKGLNNLLKCLPATHKFDDSGKSVRRIKILGLMQDSNDLTHIGYPPLHILLGADMWSQLGQYRPDLVENDGKVKVVQPVDPPFKYRPKESRDLARAEGYIKEQFPGINMPYLRLALYAKAFAQTAGLEPPIVYAWGQSGSGKTVTWELASEIGLSPVERVTLSTDQKHFAEEAATACQRSDFIIIDEVCKSDDRVKKCVAKLVLQLKRKMRYHLCYVGSRDISRLPAVLIADTDVLPAFRNDVQLARRTVAVNLEAGRVGDANWRESCNTGNVVGWRSDKRFPENAKAADTILSDVMDWVPGFKTFTEAAESLGFRTFDRADDGFDPNIDLVELFNAVCDAKDLTQTEDTKDKWKSCFNSANWVVFNLNDNRSHRVARVWSETVGDPPSSEKVQRVTGAQWGELLGVPGVVLEYNEHGRNVGLRFRIGSSRSKDVIWNDVVRQKMAEPRSNL